jgi:pimeloyl-ACP methyl ester carboxylesterase
LAVGLTNRNQSSSVSSSSNEPESSLAASNLKIFDKAVELVDNTERQFRDLPSGETMSYREYNVGQPHVLVVLPGFMADDTMASILAVLPEFQDHHIIAVNPIGWYGSTMNTPIDKHEDNADEVMELLKLLGIEKAMIGGYSTGGGIAFHMAKKYPKKISAAFLMHSILLHGMKYLDENGKPVDLEEAGEMLANMFPDTSDDTLLQVFVEAGNPEGYPPRDHPVMQYLVESAISMPGKLEATVANIRFNITPIKTPYAEPSDALRGLESKVIVLHGSQDDLVPHEVMEHVTKLAIADQWAPPGKLSFYDDGGSHMIVIDNPRAFASTYRRALEEQVLSN